MNQIELNHELGTNFIEYAAAVNSDRSIPDAKCGLKPVARRILYGALEGGRVSSKPYVKSARIVGDVMGQLHPHGDSSIYGALVRLAQDWVMRYPLIDFHGNVGSIGGDGPAASRYTGARLSKLSEDGLLIGLKKKNVNFVPNYDETMEEPETLPAIFPNLLCNPNSGIGVAMACNWAPHNLREVAQAIEDYMDGKTPVLPGPDFPTGGQIINKNDIPNIMATGHGSVKIRARYKVEKNQIIFYEIPYGTTIEGLIAEVGAACDNKELEGITDIHDESNKKGIRVVVTCDKGVSPDAIVQKIYQKTNFQTSFSYNQVALVDKTPVELNLKDCIKIYIQHNIDCLIKESNFDLEKAKARLEVVEGLIKALEDIDNIIALIKKSESAAAAKTTLMVQYNFTENQAKAILAMRLSSLAKLEKVELQEEKKSLISQIEDLNDILINKERQINIIKTRLDTLVKKYGDDRRTELTQIDIKPEDKEVETVIPEDVVVIVTKSGDVKRIAKNNFKTQRKNGKGVKTLDDVILTTISTNTIDTLMIFTNKGKMFRLLVNNIPAGTNASKGQNLATIIKMDSNEKVSAVTSLHHQTNAEYVIFFTKNGLIKKSALTEYKNIKKSTGIQAIKLKNGDELVNVTFLKDEPVIVITKNGFAIKFDTKDITATGRVTSGVKAIKLSEDDSVLIGLPISPKKKYLAIVSINGIGKKTDINEFPLQGRGGKGLLAYKSDKHIAGAALIDDTDSILIRGVPNSICIATSDLPLVSRIGIGNILIKNTNVTGVIKL